MESNRREILRTRFQSKVHPTKEDTSDSESTTSESSTEGEDAELHDKDEFGYSEEQTGQEMFKSTLMNHNANVHSKDNIKKGNGNAESTSNESSKESRKTHQDFPLHMAAKRGHTMEVHKLLEDNPDLKDLGDDNQRTPLHVAVNHVKVVNKLISKSADVNKKDQTGRTPLSYAAEQGMLESTLRLIKNKADVDLEDDNKMRPVHYAAKAGHSEVLCKLYKESNRKLKQEKELDFNCLDLAIDNDHEETVLAIFQMERYVWEEMMRSRSRLDDGRFYDTPMRKLIRKMPNVAREVFNKCTVITNDNHFKVTFYYEFLDDAYHLENWEISKQQTSENQVDKGREDPKETNGKKNSQEKTYLNDTNYVEKNHPLTIMVKSKRRELIEHPLVAALLLRKWKKVGLYFSIFNSVLYAAFLAMLTGFALKIRAPYQFHGSSSYKPFECPDFTKESIPPIAGYAKYGVIALASIELIIEILEMTKVFSYKVCSTAILFVVNTSGCNDTGYRPQWQWTCGTVSVFFAWINMLFVIRKLEWFGVYVVMLYRVVKMFMKFFLVFSLLIVAFAISFHCLFQNQEHFKTFGISLMKTTSMMIGGPDFVTTFLDETVHYEAVSYAFFSVFMLFMAIVVFNLLNMDPLNRVLETIGLQHLFEVFNSNKVGLTVSDIQEFQKRADISKKKMQVKFALDLERIATSGYFLKHFFIERLRRQEKTEVLEPNAQSWPEMKFSESWKLTERHINAALKAEKDDSPKVIAQLDTKLKTLETNLEAYIETKLKEMLEKKEMKK